MKAITLIRPWEWLILRAGKDIENRSWSTQYRGTVLLHAGRKWEERALHFAALDVGVEPYLLPVDTSEGIVGMVDIVGVCSVSRFVDGEPACACGPWAMPLSHHWQLANPRLLAEPVPCRGARMLWTVPDDVEAAVRKQLVGAT